jgi:hypothetical protein
MLAYVLFVFAQVIVDQRLGTAIPNCTVCNSLELGREFNLAI